MPVWAARLAAAIPEGGGADHDEAVLLVGIGERRQGARFAGAGVADDADDPVRAGGGGAQQRRLLGSERVRVLAFDARDRRGRSRRRVRVASVFGELERNALVAK
jgi:hypothetical protein